MKTHIDEVAVWQLIIMLAVMFSIGFMLSSTIVWEDCKMFGETSHLGTTFECKVKQ